MPAFLEAASSKPWDTHTDLGSDWISARIHAFSTLKWARPLHGNLRVKCNIHQQCAFQPCVVCANDDDITHLGRPRRLSLTRVSLSPSWPPGRQAGRQSLAPPLQCFPFLLLICPLCSLEPQPPEFTCVFRHGSPTELLKRGGRKAGFCPPSRAPIVLALHPVLTFLTIL